MASKQEELLADLKRRIAHHRLKGAIDTFFHNFLIIFALAAGVASLIAGLLWKSGPAAAVIGVFPGACALLLSNLDCVRAKNWHSEMLVELDGLLRRLELETENPSFADVASCSKALTELETRMAAQWTDGQKDKTLNLTLMKPGQPIGEKS